MKKQLGQSAINLKKNFRKLKLDKYRNAREMAEDLVISESYLYDIISLKTDKVPSVPLVEYTSEKHKIPFTSFFEDIDIDKYEKKIKDQNKRK